MVQQRKPPETKVHRHSGGWWYLYNVYNYVYVDIYLFTNIHEMVWIEIPKSSLIWHTMSMLDLNNKLVQRKQKLRIESWRWRKKGTCKKTCKKGTCKKTCGSSVERRFFWGGTVEKIFSGVVPAWSQRGPHTAINQLMYCWTKQSPSTLLI